MVTISEDKGQLIDFHEAAEMYCRGEIEIIPAQFTFKTLSEGHNFSDPLPEGTEYEKAFNENYNRYIAELDRQIEEYQRNG